MYLNHDSDTVIIDAVLTKRGRDLLSRGDGSFKITKFAVADDEVDYNLWNPNHENGSEYYGIVIENLPLIEANVNEARSMRYKLITLDKDNIYIPYLNPQSDIIMNSDQEAISIEPSTNPSNIKEQYTMQIDDTSVCRIRGRREGPGDSPTGMAAEGDRFIITPRRQLNNDAVTNATLTGNQTGATISFTITVRRYVPTNTTTNTTT